jgi:FkbM family methyltransferase
MKLHMAADYSNSCSLDHAGISQLFGEFYRLALKDNWSGLTAATIAVTFPDGLRVAPIDCRNTQFMAVNRTVAEFADGYEPELSHLLDQLVPSNGTFVDVGSNWGFFSFYLATRSDFRGHIHAFEPMGRTFADLRGLVEALRCGNLITCHQSALSDEAGPAEMAMSQGVHSGMAGIIGEGETEQGETVQKTTLDSLDLRDVDFLKIDVEGHEFKVLSGADALIRSSNPFVFFENWTAPQKPDKALEPIRFLLDRGYRLYFPAWARADGALFVRANHDRTTDTFALVPFSLMDRIVLPSNINIFAVPGSREAWLRERCSLS